MQHVQGSLAIGKRTALPKQIKQLFSNRADVREGHVNQATLRLTLHYLGVAEDLGHPKGKIEGRLAALSRGLLCVAGG